MCQVRMRTCAFLPITQPNCSTLTVEQIKDMLDTVGAAMAMNKAFDSWYRMTYSSMQYQFDRQQQDGFPMYPLTPKQLVVLERLVEIIARDTMYVVQKRGAL